MFTVSLRTQFHMPVFSGSLVIIVKPNAKEAFRAAALLMLCILQNNYQKKSCLGLRVLKICYHMSV